MSLVSRILPIFCLLLVSYFLSFRFVLYRIQYQVFVLLCLICFVSRFFLFVVSCRDVLPRVSTLPCCQVYGPESSGKTTVALHAVAQCQKAGGTICTVSNYAMVGIVGFCAMVGVVAVPLCNGWGC